MEEANQVDLERVEEASERKASPFLRCAWERADMVYNVSLCVSLCARLVLF